MNSLNTTLVAASILIILNAAAAPIAAAQEKVDADVEQCVKDYNVKVLLCNNRHDNGLDQCELDYLDCISTGPFWGLIPSWHTRSCDTLRSFCKRTSDMDHYICTNNAQRDLIQCMKDHGYKPGSLSQEIFDILSDEVAASL